jgi:endonuclease/exonuclease/phosphatase (EEP) superfamily protein YafD
MNALLMLPLCLPRAPASYKLGSELTIVTANLYGVNNRQYARTLAYIKQNHSDIVCLNEITANWTQNLRDNLPDYKYYFDEGMSGGSAILSKIPIEQQLPVQGKHVRRYGVRGCVLIGDRKLLLIAERPPAPIPSKKAPLRNRELATLAREIPQATGPVVVIGDLNVSPWSAHFQTLLRHSGLTDSALGYGVILTWSTKMFMPLVPIDHSLTTPDLVLTQRHVGPDLGSDHLPVKVHIALRQD